MQNETNRSSKQLSREAVGSDLQFLGFAGPFNIASTWPLNFSMFPNSSGSGSDGTTSASDSSSESSAASSAESSQNPTFSFIPQNPSIGLRLLTPLVPASDNRVGLFLLTSVQFLFGLSLMTRRTPRVGESKFRSRLASILRFSAGSGAVLLSGLEYTRLLLPHDPWAEEAKVWRKWAVKNGQKPSWWYGGIFFYTPMSLSEWKLKTSTWIVNTANALESTPGVVSSEDSDLLSNISIGPHSVLKPGHSLNYSEIHDKLSGVNSKKRQELLEGQLRDVTELNKAKRLDAILENSGIVHYNEEYTKPNIQLGVHTMETDDEFEMVWANFEPWDELKQETDYDIRLIPRYIPDDTSEE